MERSRAPYLLAAALLLAPAAASAQTVLVRVLSGEGATPVFGALAYLVDPAGATVRNGLTDERGRALFVGITAGTYRIRVDMIGMATTETDLFDVAEGMSVSQDVTMESSAIQLEGIAVEAEGGRCRLRPGAEGLAIADVWDEARKALAAAAFTDQQGAYRFETMIYNRVLDRDHTIIDEQQTRREGYMQTPFESRPAEDLVVNGFVQDDGLEQLYYAPDASVLLSDVFLDTHCFRLERGSGDTAGLLGLAFEPTGENKRVPDIGGTMWIDAETAELQWLEFRYEFLDPDIMSPEIGGRVDFQRMPAGTWIVPEWWIRMPVITNARDANGRPRRAVNGFSQTGGRVLEVREAGGRSLGQRVSTGGLEGVVHDSVGFVRQGVRVGVVGSNQEVYTNAEGRYSITSLTPGRYQVRFIDPDLEVLGFAPPPVARDVIRGEMTTLDYHMPSIDDVLFESCSNEARPEDSVILAGQVRDPRMRAVANATVQISWTEYRLRSAQQFSIDGADVSGFQTTSDAQGFYRFCGVPTDITVNLRAVIGDERSDTYSLSLGVATGSRLQPIEIGND